VNIEFWWGNGGYSGLIDFEERLGRGNGDKAEKD
jgi:hypothetical protein